MTENQKDQVPTMKEIADSVVELILMIRTAMSAGLYNGTIEKDGKQINFVLETPNWARCAGFSSTGQALIPMEKDRLYDIMANFEIFYKIAMAAHEFLGKRMEGYEKARDNVAVFVLADSLKTPSPQ
jgi:hypothetical protein